MSFKKIVFFLFIRIEMMRETRKKKFIRV